MEVSLITLSGPGRSRVTTQPPTTFDSPEEVRQDQLRVLAAYRAGDQLSFAGRTVEGRGGLILPSAGRIHGHKIEPVSDSTEYMFFCIEDTETALDHLMKGHPVLISAPDGSIALRWSPLTLEVYGEGHDTHSP